MSINKNIWLSAVACLPVLIGMSCKQNEAPKDKPIGTYKVIAIKPLDATLYTEYPAKIQGAQDIDIRPMVDGYIEKVHVEEGQEVRKGQLLFTINNPQYAQDINNAKALIASAEAAVAAASLQVNKTKPLVDQDIISAYELEAAQLNLSAKQAALAQARAAYNNAKINQGYTLVTSPVNGVVGLLPYRVGSYVNSATAQPLTTVSDINTVYAYFSLNEKEQLELATSNNNFASAIKDIPAVELVLSNGNVYSEKGKVESFSGQINAQTGSFNVRASFPNNQKLLRSGSSGTIRIPQYVQNGIVIPQYATTELQNKRMAYLVSDSNTVVAVSVKVTPVPGGQYFVVDSGLTTGAKLLVEGVGILTQGTKVQPQVISWDSLATVSGK